MAYYVSNGIPTPAQQQTRTIDLGVGTNFNIKALFPEDYQNLTLDNFIVCISSFIGGFGGDVDPGPGEWTAGANITVNGITPSVYYTNGILTIGNLNTYASSGWWSAGHEVGGGAGCDIRLSAPRVLLVLGTIEKL